MVFEQHAGLAIREFPNFDMAVDEFFSTLESQKIDMKAIQQVLALLRHVTCCIYRCVYICTILLGIVYCMWYI
jgi:hypothetical protein